MCWDFIFIIDQYKNKNSTKIMSGCCCDFLPYTVMKKHVFANNFGTNPSFLLGFFAFSYPIFPLSIFSSLVICKYRRTRHKAGLLVKVTKSAIFYCFQASNGLFRSFDRSAVIYFQEHNI